MMKQNKQILSAAEVNAMRDKLYNQHIPLEVLLTSPSYRRHFVRKAKYITSRDIGVYFDLRIDTAYTNNKIVVLNPMMKLPDDVGFEGRTKVNNALVAHELFHVLFTDFSTLNNIMRYKGRKMLLKTVNNILEDSYIEYTGCAVFTGDFRRDILYLRGLIMDMYPNLDEINSDTNQLVSALSHYGSCGMLKGTLNPHLVSVWEKIEPIMEKGRTELDAVKRFNFSLEITKLIEPVADNEQHQDQFENPDPVFGDNADSANGSDKGDKMSKEEVKKLLEDIDIHDLIKKARELLENAENGEENGEEEQDGQTPSNGLKIAVKGPKGSGEGKDEEGEGEAPDVVIDLSGEDSQESGENGSSDEDGPVVIKPEGSESQKSESENGEETGENSDSARGESESSDSSAGEGEESSSNGTPDQSGSGEERQKGSSDAGRLNIPDSSDGEGNGEVSISNKEKKLKELKEQQEADKKAFDELMEEIKKDYLENGLNEELENEKLRKMANISHSADYGINHRSVKNRIHNGITNDAVSVMKYEKVVSDYQNIIEITARRLKKIMKMSVEEKVTKQRFGSYNAREVNELFTDGKVFQRNKDGVGLDIAFTILVDESGSMHSEYNYQNASRAAIVFKEICDKMKIPVMVMGFTTEDDWAARHAVYANFDTPSSMKYGIANIGAYNTNRDGYSIRFAGEVMNKFYPQKKKVLIVISDGQPNHSNYGGHSANQDIVKQNSHLEKKMNTSVIAVNISSHEGIHDETFKKVVEVQQLETLPEKLVAVLKKEFKKLF